MIGTRLAMRTIKVFTTLAVLCLLAVGVLLGSLLLEHRFETTLPSPSGPFAVGRTSYVWTDSVRTDECAPRPGTRRELVVWIWYPSSPESLVVKYDEYMPFPWRIAVEHERGTLISKFLTRDLSLVHGHSARDQDMSQKRLTYPVVIMRAGLSAMTLEYSTLAEDLASHGYVVVGFDAPYRTAIVVFPDGRVIPRTKENDPETLVGQDQDRLINKLVSAWSTDMGFVLDQLELLNSSDPNGKFKGRLDMARVGVFGHSLGGATAAQFCHDDARCKAGIDVDGAPYGSVIQYGLHQPFMFLLSDHGDTADAYSHQIDLNIRSIYDRLSLRRLRIAIQGANHFNFSDGALTKSQIVMWMLRTFGILDMDGRRQLVVTAYCVRSFFNEYLMGPGVSGLKIQSPLYPEIQLRE